MPHSGKTKRGSNYPSTPSHPKKPKPMSQSQPKRARTQRKGWK